ncbi:hypothetical protein NBRC116599_05450 [Aquicoccus sp. SU-CL01552]
MMGQNLSVWSDRQRGIVDRLAFTLCTARHQRTARLCRHGREVSAQGIELPSMIEMRLRTIVAGHHELGRNKKIATCGTGD